MYDAQRCSGSIGRSGKWAGNEAPLDPSYLYSSRNVGYSVFCAAACLVGSGGADVALGGGHRFVTQQVHQDINADIGVGQFGGEGMPKTMQQSTFRAGSVDAGLPESAQYAILQCSAGDALAVATDGQRCVAGPTGQSPGGVTSIGFAGRDGNGVVG